ncbi:hypothetical protein [Runella sp.]|uniref:hypothetical protein n=1 Tax=Runella sp. TaxID=1960881 RepID=UPI00301ACB34
MKMNRIYIFYGVAIITLGLYNAWAHKQQRECQQFYSKSDEVFSGTLGILSNELENRYRTLRDRMPKKPESQTATNMLYLNESLGKNIERKGNNKPDSLWHFWQTLNDTLSQYGAHNDMTDEQLKTTQHLLDNGIPVQRYLQLRLLNLRALLIQTPVSDHIGAVYEKELLNPVYNCLPVLHLNQSCIKAGESVRGTLRSATYSKYTDNITIEVAGKSIPILNGIAPYQTVYRSSAKQAIPVQIKLTNPATRAFTIYKNNFSFESCR